MPPITENLLAPDTAANLIAQAEELKLSSLEEFAELLSVDLEVAFAFLAPLATIFGIDDLGLTDAPLNPAETQHVSVKLGHCDTPDKVAPYTPELTDTFAFKAPDDYHGATPETEEQEAEFDRFLHMDCDVLAIEATNRLGYMKEAVEIGEGELELLAHDDNMYKMARDVLKYKEEHGLC